MGTGIPEMGGAGNLSTGTLEMGGAGNMSTGTPEMGGAGGTSTRSANRAGAAPLEQGTRGGAGSAPFEQGTSTGTRLGVNGRVLRGVPPVLCRQGGLKLQWERSLFNGLRVGGPTLSTRKGVGGFSEVGADAEINPRRQGLNPGQQSHATGLGTNKDFNGRL